ncbi:MAG: YitT family protein [Bacilli bacterium]
MAQQGIFEKHPALRTVLEYFGVLVGSVLVGASFNLFLLPNQIASGGVSGISTILQSTLGLEPAYVQWAFNIPLFALGFFFLGKQFGLKTLFGTLIGPFVVFLTNGLDPATQDPLLAALFGGLGIGVGLGVVFRSHGSTGGVDVIAQIIHRYFGFPLGTAIAMIDGLIVTTAAIVFDLESAMYALIALFVTSKTINVVQIGFQYSKMALIITNEEEKVRSIIFDEVDRGVTKLQAEGGYTQSEKAMLLVVVDQTEFNKLKSAVQSADPDAFVVVVDSTEVHGRGFGRPKVVA